MGHIVVMRGDAVHDERILTVLRRHLDPELHGGMKQTVRYVLTPSHWPGQPITLPLTDEQILKKVR